MPVHLILVQIWAQIVRLKWKHQKLQSKWRLDKVILPELIRTQLLQSNAVKTKECGPVDSALKGPFKHRKYWNSVSA